MEGGNVSDLEELVNNKREPIFAYVKGPDLADTWR